jgi:hypothetical protein
MIFNCLFLDERTKFIAIVPINNIFDKQYSTVDNTVYSCSISPNLLFTSDLTPKVTESRPET